MAIHTIEGLLESGKVNEGTVLVMNRRTGKHRGRVVKPGKIKVGRKEYETPTAAAKAITGGEVNGWAAWRVEETGEPLADLR